MNGLKTIDFTGIIFLFGILIYVSGWSYAKEYFNNYNIGMEEIRLSIEHIMVYGLWAIESKIVDALLMFMLLLVFVFTVGAVENKKIVGFLSIIFIAVYFFSVSLFYNMGKNEGNLTFREQKENFFESLPNIEFKQQNDKEIQKGKLIINIGNLLYLIKNNEKVIVVKFNGSYESSMKNNERLK